MLEKYKDVLTINEVCASNIKVDYFTLKISFDSGKNLWYNGCVKSHQ